MPQMMPMWWLLIFLVMISTFSSSMSIINELVVFTPLEGSMSKTQLKSWLK